MNPAVTTKPMPPVCAQKGVPFTCRFCGADSVHVEDVDLGPWVFDGAPFIYIKLRCRQCRAIYLGGTEFNRFIAIQGEPQ